MCSNSNDSSDTAEPAEPDDWGYDGYSAAYEYIQACVNAGHSEEDCKNWYFE